MRYTAFGRRTGLRVSEYALGTGNFGSRWRPGAEPPEARRIFELFAEAGGTFLDTAATYQLGEAEELLGSFIARDRDHFVVATKFSNNSGADRRISDTGNSRKNMVRSVEASLRRLKTDYVDLLWAHFPDPLTPIEEVLRGFDDLIHSGKVLHGGLSNFPAWRVSRAASIADFRGMAPLIAVQLEYSLLERTAERELFPMAEALGLAIAPYSPLGGGLLTGKYRKSDAGRLTDWQAVVHTEDSAQKVAILNAVLAISQETDAPASQVAMAWLRHRGQRSATAVVPVIGPRSAVQLEHYLQALDLVLSEEHLAILDDLSAIEAGQPHKINASVRDVILGGDASAVVLPIVPVA